MKPLQATTLEKIIKVTSEIAEVYNSLTPEQQQEVDDFNAKLIKAADSGDPEQVRALGVSPMLAHMERAGK
jgi:hypothetical protein